MGERFQWRAPRTSIGALMARMSLTTMLMNNKTQPADRGVAIYKALWHAIIEQAPAPGAKLPEDAIGGEK
jgi:hypothetical protein